MPLQKNQILPLAIESLSSDGSGVARGCRDALSTRGPLVPRPVELPAASPGAPSGLPSGEVLALGEGEGAIDPSEGLRAP